MIKRLESEGGYSLVEVMVSILILTIAIIPMVTMFDTGLRSAVLGSNYDKARALAKKQLEQAQTLPYSAVKNNFPNAPCTFNGSGLCEVTNLEVPASEDPNGLFDDFRYTIRKQYVEPNDSGGALEFNNSGTDKSFMRITVIVRWGGAGFNDKEYTTTALKSR